jgi:RimJ/RimL family protein N-acetyltransferase
VTPGALSPDPAVRPPRGPQPGLTLPGGLTLRRWAQDDAPALFLALHDPLVRHYSGFLLEDVPAARVMLQRLTAVWERGDGAAWAISDGGGTVLGSVRFGLLDSRLGVGSVGYWLLPEGRGRGVATAAVRRATRAVFDRLRWHRIELYHAVENERSCALARRCGYLQEGVMREAMRYPDDGRWSDEHLHARLAGDAEPG